MSSHLKKLGNDYMRMALILFLITSIIGGMLAAVHYFTAPVAERFAEERLNRSLFELIDGADEFVKVVEYPESILLGTVQVPIRAAYRAIDSVDESLGYCINVTPMGYADIIDMMVAIDKDGLVSGVEILSISDSPGISSKVKANDELQTALKGINDPVKIVKTPPTSKTEVQVIAGATISSAAYINGVNAAVEVAQLLRVEEVPDENQ